MHKNTPTRICRSISTYVVSWGELQGKEEPPTLHLDSRLLISFPAKHQHAFGFVPQGRLWLLSSPPSLPVREHTCQPGFETRPNLTVGFPVTEPVNHMLIFSSILLPFTFQVPSQSFKSRIVVYSGSLPVNTISKHSPLFHFFINMKFIDVLHNLETKCANIKPYLRI